MSLNPVLILGFAQSELSRTKTDSADHATIATILVEAGMDLETPCGYLEEHARQRGEDGVIAIKGALILSQGLNDPTSFQRVMQQLPQTLCRDLPKQKTKAKKTG